ncbi:hypothetical protein [Myroides odoratimimus]|uniref:hypothetical protein n=1 Tax=Myroides odoratimimus TaxID=76832 RepID=UPI001CE18254|nr:hypothetical protein [Myroides odoratimimus]MCA4806538.1 hypothetical protein [Myroides odoratimimus]
MKIEEEKLNKAVITSKDIVSGKSFISHVYYDEDRDWQFFDGTTIKEDDALVISVKQILEIDPSLKALPEMHINESMFRKNKEDIWQKF